MQNSVVLLIFSFLDQKEFLGKFGPTNQNRHFKLKFGTKTNLNMQNSMVMPSVSVLDRKYCFWAIWRKKSKLSVKDEIWYLD